MTKYTIEGYSGPVLETTRATDGVHLDTDASSDGTFTTIGYRLARCSDGGETVLAEETKAIDTTNITLAEACGLLYGLRAAVTTLASDDHLFIYVDNRDVYGSLYGARPCNHDVFTRIYETLPSPDSFSLIRIASEKNRAHDLAHASRRRKVSEN
jgi:hypothetical protein